MTKAKARARAKAKAGKKAKSPASTSEKSNEKTRAPQFDPGSGRISSPGARASTKSFAETKRGAARSR